MNTALVIPTRRPFTGYAHLAGQRAIIPASRAVCQLMRTPERVTVSEWAENYRRVTEIDATPGPWRTDLVPHTRQIMDTIGRPWVREVWICAVERSAKTQVLLNTACWAIDRGSQAGNIFWLMPTEHDARRAMGERVIPVLRASRKLAAYLPDRHDDITRGTIRFRHGLRLFPAWANSPSSIASYFGRLNIADEVDKFPDRTSEGTDPITLFKKRARDDRSGSKYVYCSTPAGRYIYAGMNDCRQIWNYRLKCPHCGEMIDPDLDHLIIPDGASAAHIGGPVGYACNACAVVWSEDDRESAYVNGQWIAVKGADLPRPESVGFHLPALQMPRVPLAEIAAAVLRAKSGDLPAKIALANGYQAIDYEDALSTRDEDAILALRDERAEGELPSDPFAAISCIADMQKRGFWYTIRAWGFGLEMESWLLKTGFVDSWEALRRVMFESEFIDHHGQRHHITLCAMDSGGGESEDSDLSRTAESYLFAARNPGVLLFKGQQKMSSWYRHSPQDKIPGTNKALPGAVPLYLINATHFKDRLAAKLQVNPADPGAWHLHKDIGDDFARQMCAEGKDEKGYWQNPKNRPNHLWDCSYMELALAEIAGIKIRKRPEEATTTAQRRVYSKGVKRD